NFLNLILFLKIEGIFIIIVIIVIFIMLDIFVIIWVFCSRKGANYLKKLNLYLYAKNVLNIEICSEIILTQFLFFLVVCSLSIAKSPYYMSKVPSAEHCYIKGGFIFWYNWRDLKGIRSTVYQLHIN